MRPKRDNIPPGDLSCRNKILVSMFPWRLLKLKELPRNHLKALFEHQVGDHRPTTIEELEEKLGGPRARIGVVTIPMQALVLQVMGDPSQRNGDFECFAQFHREFLADNKGRVPHYKQRWPIILSGNGWSRQTIVDGWHRFHAYYRANAKNVFALWYADE